MIETITRIQFEPDGTGRFRWRVWAGSSLIHDELSRTETIDAILFETKLLCTDSFFPGDQNAEAIEKDRASEAANGQQTGEVSPGLD